MEFEEVLFPAMYVGKKKYCGVTHEKFDSDESIIKTIHGYKEKIFLRGLDFKKKNMAKIINTFGMELLYKAFNLNNVK